MPKKLLSTAVIMLLAIAVLSSLPMLKANFIPIDPEIRILEPMRQNIKLYEETPIPLTLTITEPENAPQNYHQITKIYYSIDGQPAVEIVNITKKTNQPLFSGTVTEYHAYATIDTIESGSHDLMVYAVDDVGNRLSKNIGFAYQTIDKYPNVTIFSPLNTTYLNTTKLILNFTADNFIVAFYSLDGIDTVFYSAQNGTLHARSGLTEGEHTLLLRVFTEFGWFSQTIRFVVDGANSPAPSITPTPSVPAFSWLILLSLFLFTLLIGISIKIRKVHLRRMSIPQI